MATCLTLAMILVGLLHKPPEKTLLSMLTARQGLTIYQLIVAGPGGARHGLAGLGKENLR